MSRRARQAVQEPANEVLVSAASAWEIAIKVHLRRMELPDDPQRFVPDQIEANSFGPLAVQIRHALKVAELPDIHRDPFDRLLVAQAAVEGLVLVTADPQLRRYPIETIW